MAYFYKQPNMRLESYINSYASETFQERADMDYITARMCYFNDLIPNFLWNAQQAIEKYLKAIGLFNRINIKNDGHDLKNLFNAINKKLSIGSIKSFPRKNDFPKDFPTIDESFESFLKRMTY